MAVPRTRLGGFLGGGTIQPRNEIDIGGAIDAAVHGASSLIQNAYARKRQLAQDKAVEDQRTQLNEDRRFAREAAEQDRGERSRTGERDYQLRLRTITGTEEERRLKAAELERQRIEKENAPKVPVRGTPEYDAMREREILQGNRLRPVPAGSANATTPTERNARAARSAVPTTRPPEARPAAVVDDKGVVSVQPPPDPNAAARFVADSTAKDMRATDLEGRAGLAPPPKLHIPYGGGAPYPLRTPNAVGPPTAPRSPDGTPKPTTGGHPPGTPEHVQSWLQANPQQPGETEEAYKARYKASLVPPSTVPPFE